MSLFGRSYGCGHQGSVLIEGREADVSTVAKAVEAGISYVTEDRKALGLVLEEPVVRNVTLANLAAIARRGILDKRRETNVAEDDRKALSIRTPGGSRKW
jgi:putative multiple sugar transport system ATP-binding protein